MIGRSNWANPRKVRANAAQELPTAMIDEVVFRGDWDGPLLKVTICYKAPWISGTDHQSLIAGSRTLRQPVGQKHVEFPRFFGISIRYPNETLAVRGKHGETIKVPFRGETF